MGLFPNPGFITAVRGDKQKFAALYSEGINSVTLELSPGLGAADLSDAEAGLDCPGSMRILQVADGDFWERWCQIGDLGLSITDPASGVVRDYQMTIVEPTPTPTPPPTRAPTPTLTLTPTRPPTPTPTPTPAPTLENLRNYMLDLINADRREHGLSPVTLGHNPAAQHHAEDMREHQYVGHWGRDGLTPYMRYTLAGGVNYESENTSGYRNVGKLRRKAAVSSVWRELDQVQQGLMDSPGHRRNILNQWHKKVNLGIACHLETLHCWVVQQFQGDYLEFVDQPEISSGVLSFHVRTKGRFTFSSVQVWYDQPPHPLSLGQLDRTYSYLSGQEPATFILQPAQSGYYYSATDLLPVSYTWRRGTDPYSLDPDLARLKPNPFLLEIPFPARPALKLVPWTVADAWDVSGDSLAVKADLSAVSDDLGPGVYTVYIWGEADDEDVVLAKYSVFVD